MAKLDMSDDLIRNELESDTRKYMVLDIVNSEYLSVLKLEPPRTDPSTIGVGVHRFSYKPTIQIYTGLLATLFEIDMLATYRGRCLDEFELVVILDDTV